MFRRVLILLVLTTFVALNLVLVSPAIALVNPTSFYDKYAPMGWTYNAGANSTYNCLSYALGYTDRWLWPSYWGIYASEGEVDSFMSANAKTRCSSSSSPRIIAYGYAGDIRHFGKVTSCSQTLAKWGGLERFSHNWNPYLIKQSDAFSYGAGIRYYK